MYCKKTNKTNAITRAANFKDKLFQIKSLLYIKPCLNKESFNSQYTAICKDGSKHSNNFKQACNS